MRFPSFKIFFRWWMAGAVALLLVVLVMNLDVALRSMRAMRQGRWSSLLLRYELAAFNFGMKSPFVALESRVSGRDGMRQVFVPAGEFLMGNNRNPTFKEYPEHQVYLDAFWVDQVEVSNAMYARCVRAGDCLPPVLRLNPYYGKWVYRDLPVVYVNWYAAERYCVWAGRRLPTEAEWEKAARGSDGRYFPWGNSAANPRLANFAGTLILEALPVQRYALGASPYGALNMAGNVREWVADWFLKDYYRESPVRNPQGPADGTERSLRGGAYDAQMDDVMTFRRFRHEPDSAGLSRGFRCAESALR